MVSASFGKDAPTGLSRTENGRLSVLSRHRLGWKYVQDGEGFAVCLNGRTLGCAGIQDAEGFAVNFSPRRHGEAHIGYSERQALRISEKPRIQRSAVRIERIRTGSNLHAIGEAVAIGIGVERVGTENEFETVG